MNDEEGWTDVCGEGDLPVGQGMEVVVGDAIVALFHDEAGWHALSGICPHHGGPLGKGSLKGCVVTCPWHGWQFDVRDGTYQHSDQLKHPTFATRVSDGRVAVRLT